VKTTVEAVPGVNVPPANRFQLPPTVITAEAFDDAVSVPVAAISTSPFTVKLCAEGFDVGQLTVPLIVNFPLQVRLPLF